MKTSLPSTCVIATCVILTGADCVFAQDWPQWRGPNRDGKVTGFKAPRTWPKELAQKWKAQVGLGDATPSLVGDRLYVFARQDMDEVTVCLDAGTGKELWRDPYAAQSVSGADGSHLGPRSSPAVAEGKIVTLGVGGILSCLDAATGKVVWRKDEFPKVAPRFHTAMSPIIVDGLAIAHQETLARIELKPVKAVNHSVWFEHCGDLRDFGRICRRIKDSLAASVASSALSPKQ